MGITSTGIGSGLDVESIVTKLVALEKQPLKTLQTKADKIQTQISTYSQIKSLASTFADAAAKLTRDSTWGAMTVTSSNSSAVSANITGLASASSFSVEVQQLAKAQSTASTAVTAGSAVGSGTMTLQLGQWNSTFDNFEPGTAAAASISVAATDTLSTIAGKINDAGAGVVASVVKDSAGERLMLRSSTTGAAAGFRLQVTDDDGNDTDDSGLSSLAFDPASGAFGMAANTYQKAQDTNATINGIAVTSPNNTFSDVIAGLQISVTQETTAPVQMNVSSDTAAVKKSVQDFVTAYNALNDQLSSALQYDANTKTAGALQGDASTVGLQNMMRSILGSSTTGSALQTLSSVGISVLRGGNLSLDNSKLDTVLKSSPTDVKNLFAANTGNSQTDGIARKLKAFTTTLLSYDGSLNSKNDALAAASKRNLDEQDKVTARAAVVEKRLRAQYSALDTQMGSLTALNSYVTQQISQWNKSSN